MILAHGTSPGAVSCTGNSARSQIAEGLLTKLSRGRAEVFSAGTRPEAEVHPAAVDVLRTRFHVDTDGLHPRHLNHFLGHWSFEDPAATQDEEARRRAFESVADGLAARMRIWMALPAVHRRLDAAEE